jgi:hypothetical protein
MPVYIELANLIVPKSTIEKKYTGGADQFRTDYSIDGDNRHQEDDLLFSISRMNCDDYDLKKLVEKGLDYDFKEGRSTDFTILARYGGVLWDMDWLEYNGMFAWHINTEEEKIDMARKRNELTMDKISEMFELGMNPFKTI